MTFKVSPFFDTSEGMVWKKILNNEIEIEATSGMKVIFIKHSKISKF